MSCIEIILIIFILRIILDIGVDVHLYLLGYLIKDNKLDTFSRLLRFIRNKSNTRIQLYAIAYNLPFERRLYFVRMKRKERKNGSNQNQNDVWFKILSKAKRVR